jgi:hypothetical protein
MLLALLLVAAPHDFSAQRVMSKVIIYVKEDFAYPDRIKLPEMYRAALQRLAKEYPALNLTVDPTGAVAIGKKRFAAPKKLDALWHLAFALKDVAEFIAREQPGPTNEYGRPMEIAMVNGMLSVLDAEARLVPTPPGQHACQWDFPDDTSLLLPCHQPAK